MRKMMWLAGVLSVVLAPSVGLAGPTVVYANQGFNVVGQTILQNLTGTDSAATQVPFYDGTNAVINNNVGTQLRPGLIILPSNNSYTFTLANPGAIFAPPPGYNIIGASLFVDVVANNVLGVQVPYNFALSINGTPVGSITNNGLTLFPTADGGQVNVPGDPNNAYFTIPPSLFAALAGNANLTVLVTRTSGAAIIDGINIQTTATPEPATMALFGVMAVGAGVVARRRKMAKA